MLVNISKGTKIPERNEVAYEVGMPALGPAPFPPGPCPPPAPIQGLQGIQGIQGLQGIQGALGLHGHMGPQGLTGKGIRVLSYVDEVVELPITDVEVGDGYTVGLDLYIFEGLGNGDQGTPGTAWKNMGKFQGPQGVQGPMGDVTFNEELFTRNSNNEWIYPGKDIQVNLETCPTEGYQIIHNFGYYPVVTVYSVINGIPKTVEIEVIYTDLNTVTLKWNDLLTNGHCILK